MKRKLIVKIDGTDKQCHCQPIPVGAHPKDCPVGTCQYFRQFPNGEDPRCLLFQKDVRSNRALARSVDGFALRVPECRAAEELSQNRKEVLIEIVAGESSCETTSIIDTQSAHPWIDSQPGFPILYRPDQVCRLHVSFPQGSSYCRLPSCGPTFTRNLQGFTQRLSICLKAEVVSH